MVLFYNYGSGLEIGDLYQPIWLFIFYFIAMEERHVNQSFLLEFGDLLVWFLKKLPQSGDHRIGFSWYGFK